MTPINSAEFAIILIGLSAVIGLLCLIPMLF